MRAPGCDPDDLCPSDFLCDFCRRPWAEERPMVEGHRGSCICGECLARAYRDLVLDDGATGGRATCTLCLETRDEPAWRHDGDGGAAACRRCVRQSAAVLQKDPDSGWRRPDR